MTPPQPPPPQPGRLGDRTMSLLRDPRTHPKVLSTLSLFGLDKSFADEPAHIHRSDPLEKKLDYVANFEAGVLGFYDVVPIELPADGEKKRGEGEEEEVGVRYWTERIIGVDGNEIVLHLFRPVVGDGGGLLPCVVYIHGGAMTIGTTYNRLHKKWCESLALSGLVVIAIDFRNAYNAREKKLDAFPAGLNDVGSGVAWIDARREELGITKIVLEGESGGGNLCLATALKAKRDGRLGMIDGVYALVPCISGDAYAWDEGRKVAELPSLVECDGYFLSCRQLDLLAGFYDPSGEHGENPLAWPLYAEEEELVGLPPHVVSVDELDPLRDEGKAYFRKLLRAGVEARGRVNLGIPHGMEFLLRQAIPQVYKATVADIKEFAYSV
ncbi:Brefeldin A esterase [Periconia macrospinosa]|uniref:Brefeldin A esterase n=1 Tax=Periconia macrospinosa TaxID=97972 RepID=A0A2V1D322_9PLEO|nr:Brefeldin A esterase [Periconia macrospinosa]